MDSGNVDDIYCTPQNRRHVKSAELNIRTMDTSLSPIREMSVGRELADIDKQGRQLNHQVSLVDSDRSVTPTTDSAINMSQSSSEDEQRVNRPSSASTKVTGSRPSRHRTRQSDLDALSMTGSTKFRQLSLNSSHSSGKSEINSNMSTTEHLESQKPPTIPAKITTITDGKLDSTPSTSMSVSKNSRRENGSSAEVVIKKPIASPRQHLPPRKLSSSTPSDSEEPNKPTPSQEQAMYEAVNIARHIILSEEANDQPIESQATNSEPIREEVNPHQPITRLSGRNNHSKSKKSYIPTQSRPKTLGNFEVKDSDDSTNQCLSDSMVGDEVELEIVFPKGKSPRYYSEL